MNKINKNGKIMFKISCREMKFDLFWCLTFISNLHLGTFSLKATAKIGPDTIKLSHVCARYGQILAVTLTGC